MDLRVFATTRLLLRTDADVDGAHISTSTSYFLLPLYARSGKGWTCLSLWPPLFGLIKGTGSNRKIDYIYDEEALKQRLPRELRSERKRA